MRGRLSFISNPLKEKSHTTEKDRVAESNAELNFIWERIKSHRSVLLNSKQGKCVVFVSFIWLLVYIFIAVYFSLYQVDFFRLLTKC